MTFEELAVPLLSPLYTYARWLTSDAHEAEDLVQETYLKGLRGFGSFTQGTNFRATSPCRSESLAPRQPRDTASLRCQPTAAAPPVPRKSFVPLYVTGE